MSGRIRDEDVEEIRRRASLIEVAADYMQVKRAGRLFKALCPFHAEKTPSLSLDPIKGLYYCHGCSEGGDVIQLVRKLENLSFVETVERLAQRTGIELRYEQLSPSDRKAQKRRLRLVDGHRRAAEYYHETLKHSSEAADARAYLIKQRGFTTETLETFRAGFSPSKRDELSKHLRGEGFAEDELIDAGLAVRADGGGLIDRFRGRVMFPILSITGDPIAFGARRMGDGDGPKYLNSAESPIYQKGRELYGLSLAKGDVVKLGRALIVEGYTDVIALHQAGIREAVATCGTALGLEHLRTLQRFTQQVILSLDSDEAGGRAAERTYDQLIGDAQQMGLSARVVLMQPGQDPADSVMEIGPDGFRALVDGAVPLLEFVLKREADRYHVGDPDEQARALAAGIRLLGKTEKQSLVDEYVRRLASWIGVDANVIYYELGRMKASGTAPRAIGEAVVKRSSGQVRKEREAIKLAIQEPMMIKRHIDDMEDAHFSVPAHRAIWRAISSGADPLSVGILDEEARKVYTALAVDPPVGEVTERLVDEIFGRLKEFVVSRQIEELKARLQRLNPTTDPAGYESLFTELIELERTKRRLSEDGEEAG